MDVTILSRLQFAIATYFHFLFVPLTLGLVWLLVWMETKYVKTGDEEYKRMAKFWGKIYLINFAIGVVTGITLEFQFGTNWSRYSQYVGDIFGSLLAIEATVAFFLESTFIAVWVFGWDKLSKKMHLLAIWLVAIGTNVSAIWILTANAWMQHPVGYVLRNGRAELTDFAAVVFQPYVWLKFVHQITAAMTLAGFFVAGVSAYHLMRGSNISFFKKSFKVAITYALIASIIVVLVGHEHAAEVAKTQPTKLAAMESLWETRTNAPIYLLLWPDVENEKNAIEALPIPSMLSILAFKSPSAEVKGLKDFPKDERPPILPTFLSFRIMVGLGFLFILLTLYGFLKRDEIENHPKFLKILLYSVPLTYLAILLGWTLAEVGRQPWIVYGLMKVKDAVSPTINSTQVIVSVTAFTLVYSLLGFAAFYLIFKTAKKGPKA